MADGDELRALMRRFPSGVAVVTVDNGREQTGLTVGSLVSLSLQPPLVGVSIARTSPFHDLIDEAAAFAVNVLAADQASLAQHFARSGMPPLVRWDGIARRAGTVAPLLEGAAGWLECRIRERVPVGTHTFFVGEVERVEPGRGDGALSYLDGSFHPL
jgi:flavin reductase (DIM6/NTAB) family NADH-FMN oxidoreductase RutF